jgi:hypothetical protein
VKSVASLLNSTNNKLQPDLQGLEKKKKKKKSQSFLAVLCYHKSSAEIRRRRVYDQNPKLNFPMSQEFLSLKVGTLLSDTEIRALWREPSFLVGVHGCSTWQPESNHKRACHIHEMAERIPHTNTRTHTRERPNSVCSFKTCIR